MNAIPTLPLLERFNGTVKDMDRTITQLIGRAQDEEDVCMLANLAEKISLLKYFLSLPLECTPRQAARLHEGIVSSCEISGKDIECAIIDISIGGALIVLEEDAPPSSTITLHHPIVGDLSATVVGTTNGGVHVAFRDLPKESRKALVNLVTEAFVQ